MVHHFHPLLGPSILLLPDRRIDFLDFATISMKTIHQCRVGKCFLSTLVSRISTPPLKSHTHYLGVVDDRTEILL
jgi:hypothetical protein